MILSSLLRILVGSMALASMLWIYFKGREHVFDNGFDTNFSVEKVVGCCNYTPKSKANDLELLATTQTLRPPLADLVEVSSENITGDVQFLLDFAIVGREKCGTTFLMEWLAKHDQVQIHMRELHGLQHGKPYQLVQEMYELPEGVRGYKNPGDLGDYRVLNNFRKYWPKTKLIVGVRHPIRYFETFYNFLVRNGYNMPPADSKVFLQKCQPEVHNVCTEHARFHEYLSLLGKTNLTQNEVQLLTPFTKKRPENPIPNRLFLYELNQMHDFDADRAFRFRRDLSDFLGLNQTLAEISLTNSSRVKRNVLNICEARYDELRNVLLKIAQDASSWIRKYFMIHPDIVVSSPKYFQELLEAWMVDPCT